MHTSSANDVPHSKIAHRNSEPEPPAPHKKEPHPAGYGPDMIMQRGYRHSNAPRQRAAPASLRISTSVCEPRSSSATESVWP